MEGPGCRAISFASGMAAITAVADLVPVGAVVVSQSVAYSGTRTQLARWHESGRIHLREVAARADELAEAADGAAMVWLETPTNPTLEVVDIAAVAAAAHASGALVVVDSTFATPLGQKPLDLGADVVVHSATKYLAGHSDVLLGAVIARDAGPGRARHPQPGPRRRDPRADGGLDRPARAAHLPAALGARVRQRGGDRPSVQRPPRRGQGAAPEPARRPRT